MGYLLLAFVFVAVIVVVAGIALTGAEFLNHVIDALRSVGVNWQTIHA